MYIYGVRVLLHVCLASPSPPSSPPLSRSPSSPPSPPLSRSPSLTPSPTPSPLAPAPTLTLALGLARYDALVCTPLRLVSLIEKESLSLHTVSLLIMDEADKLLELGFLEQART